MTTAAPTDQRLPITSVDQPLAGLQVAEGEGVLRAEHLQAEARGRPEGPSGADDHGQGLLVERVRTEGVHPVPDERHPGAAFQEEPLRSPGPELRHGIDVCGADRSLRGVDRHPEHFGADVHARIRHDIRHRPARHQSGGTGNPPRIPDNRPAASRTRRRPRTTPSRRRRPVGSTVPGGLPGRTPWPGQARAGTGRAPRCASRGSRQPPCEVGAHLRVVVADARARRRPGRTSVDRSTRL